MRTRWIGLGALMLGLSALGGSTAKAQDGGFSDPFFLYYGYFLPRQNALAHQAQPEDLYRAQAVQRTYAATTDRQGLYDPSSAIGYDELDPLRPFGTRTGSSRLTPTVPTGLRTSIARTGHSAPRSYFTNHGSYFPSIRSGSGSPSRRGPAVSSGAAAGAGLPRGLQLPGSYIPGIGGRR